jgi:hypothetical protein
MYVTSDWLNIQSPNISPRSLPTMMSTTTIELICFEPYIHGDLPKSKLSCSYVIELWLAVSQLLQRGSKGAESQPAPEERRVPHRPTVAQHPLLLRVASST